MPEGKEGFVPPQEGHEQEGGDQEVIEINDVKDGEELLSRLPEKFDGNAEITVTGKVKGREETQTVNVRGDVVDFELDREGDFWALKAIHADNSETLLRNGNFFSREDGELMATYATPVEKWDWRKKGEEMVGRLTDADTYNIARFDEITHATVKIDKVEKPEQES